MRSAARQGTRRLEHAPSRRVDTSASRARDTCSDSAGLRHCVRVRHKQTEVKEAGCKCNFRTVVFETGRLVHENHDVFGAFYISLLA